MKGAAVVRATGLLAMTLAPLCAGSQTASTAARLADSLKVHTLTGPIPAVERPNATLHLSVGAKISELPVHNLSQLLSGRFAGVQVMSNGATGTGSRIRIRGQSSLLLGNDPLVIIDGARLNSLVTTSGMSVPSRFDDLNVNEIENIEILSGPSAATLYGTGATNGVIDITTKRGKAGKTQVHVYSENGLISDPNTYPDLYALWGRRSGSALSGICTLSLVSAGTCTVDSLSHGNVMHIDSLKPVGMGYRSEYGAAVSGGSRHLQFFLSGERENEAGVYKMPTRDATRLMLQRGVSKLPSDQTRPSGLMRNSFRANVSAQIAPGLSLQLANAYVRGDVQLVPNGGQSNGIGYNATGGVWRQDLRDMNGVPLAGYATSTAGDIMSQKVTQGIDRYINSAAVTFNPIGWFASHAAVGYDNAKQTDRIVITEGEGIGAFVDRHAVNSSARTNSSLLTLDLGASAIYQESEWLKATTSVGMQRTKAHTAATFTSPGFRSFSASESQNTGYWAEERLAFNDEFFVTGGVRRDSPTWLHIELGAATYPTAGVSWNITNPASRGATWLNTLRLRAAFGTSGRIPQFEERLAAAALLPQFLYGNTAPVKPERTVDSEGGFDVAMFTGASRIAFTYYRKNTTDAVIVANNAPSLINPPSAVRNAAAIQNSGVELTYNQRIMKSKRLSANINIAGSANRNRMTALDAGIAPIFTGDRSSQKNLPGYPLFGFWSRTYTYNDANHDGILTVNELQISDTAQFIGSSFPTRELAVTPALELGHRLRLSAQIDSKWGFRKFNNTLRHQCQSAASCRGLNDRTAPLETQAAALAVTRGVYSGLYEDASFTRFREAAVSYALPVHWANAIRASSWNVVLTGRNLALSTRYKGTDPESSVSTTDARQDEYFSTPSMRYFTLRFDITF